ncbi:MAG: DNA/RNA non-specific endonuclease [Alistipes sp.]|nr:DNA/RNA non-specific endonuclease [Alistipes sp.]
MKRFLTLLLIVSTTLFLACKPELPFGDDTNDDSTEQPTPTPTPDPDPEPEPEPENPTPDPEPEPEPTPDPEPAEVTATLTYDECESVISGYENPRNYTNSYGTWIVCAYGGNKDIQINSNKVAYIGTPTFTNNITKIKIEFKKSYSGEILLCSQAGTKQVSGQFESFSCSGTSTEHTLTTTGKKSFYIRSSACANITAIYITYGGSGNGGGTTPTPDPDPTPTPDPTPDPEPEPEPDPTPGEGTNPSTYAYDWAELPVVNYTKEGSYLHSNNKTLYYAHHLCAGNEKNAQRNGSARNYTVCYSAEHHCPLWVAAPRHSSYEVKNTDRTDAYGKDPKIPSDIQYSSKNTGGGCNKGHMLGSAERLCSAATNRQVFYYTNIAPQYSDTFNTGGGAWNNLEDHIDGLVCRDTLYTVIGCYFDSFSKNGPSAAPKKISFGGRSDVSCPTMFYYALLRTKSGSSGKRVQDCSAGELQCAAFVICHKMEKGHKPQASDIISIAELEKLTGVTYFPNVPNAPKSTYNANDWL